METARIMLYIQNGEMTHLVGGGGLDFEDQRRQRSDVVWPAGTSNELLRSPAPWTRLLPIPVAGTGRYPEQSIMEYIHVLFPISS